MYWYSLANNRVASKTNTSDQHWPTANRACSQTHFLTTISLKQSLAMVVSQHCKFWSVPSFQCRTDMTVITLGNWRGGERDVPVTDAFRCEINECLVSKRSRHPVYIVVYVVFAFRWFEICNSRKGFPRARLVTVCTTLRSWQILTSRLRREWTLQKTATTTTEERLPNYNKRIPASLKSRAHVQCQAAARRIRLQACIYQGTLVTSWQGSVTNCVTEQAKMLCSLKKIIIMRTCNGRRSLRENTLFRNNRFVRFGKSDVSSSEKCSSAPREKSK